MPKPRKVIEDSEFSFGVDAKLKPPRLPHVPTPPIGKHKEASQPPKRINEGFVESELKKIEFFVENRMADDAKGALDLLMKTLHQGPAGLREKFQYDLKRVETAIELIGL